MSALIPIGTIILIKEEDIPVVLEARKKHAEELSTLFKMKDRGTSDKDFAKLMERAEELTVETSDKPPDFPDFEKAVDNYLRAVNVQIDAMLRKRLVEIEGRIPSYTEIMEHCRKYTMREEIKAFTPETYRDESRNTVIHSADWEYFAWKQTLIFRVQKYPFQLEEMDAPLSTIIKVA